MANSEHGRLTPMTMISAAVTAVARPRRRRKPDRRGHWACKRSSPAPASRSCSPPIGMTKGVGFGVVLGQVVKRSTVSPS